jgi:hypothetical protein
MSQDAPAIVTARHRFGLIDVLILGASIALGIWVYRTDPKNLEGNLGLGDTQARFEEQPTPRAARPRRMTPLRGQN